MKAGEVEFCGRCWRPADRCACGVHRKLLRAAVVNGVLFWAWWRYGGARRAIRRALGLHVIGD